MPKQQSRLNQPWTDHDKRVLRAGARAKKSARQVAITLRRSRGAVAFKAMDLGVHFQNVKQPRGVQSRIQRARIEREKRAA